MGGSESPMDLVMPARSIPEPRPKVNIATNTAISSAMNGLPMTSKTCWTRFSSSSMTMSAIALAIISTTGSSTEARVMPNDGRLLDGLFLAGRRRCAERVRRPSGRQRPNSGPETMTVGMATSRPSISVVPRSALRVSMAISGPGCGGTSPCIAERPGQRRDADGDHRELRATGDQVDHRHQQHEADLEEHRQADQRTDTGHRPGQRPLATRDRRWCRRSGRPRRSRPAAWRTSHRGRSASRRRRPCHRSRSRSSR